MARSPFIRTVEKSSDYQVVNALGVTVFTASEPDLCFAFIEECAGSRGPLTVELVKLTETRQVIRRLRRVAA